MKQDTHSKLTVSEFTKVLELFSACIIEDNRGTDQLRVPSKSRALTVL